MHNEDAVRHAVQVAAGQEGRLDMAVNSAGIDGGNDAHPTVDYPSIVNISSGAGLVAVRGYSGYAASKHAEIGLTKSAALDYGPLGIRVNALCPGLVNTPLSAEMVDEKPREARRTCGVAAEPEEIADAIVWLCSQRSSYVTGIALPIDGGYTAR